MGLVCRVSLFPLPDRAHHIDAMFITGSVRFSGRLEAMALSYLLANERAHRLLALSYVKFTSNVKRFRRIIPVRRFEWLSSNFDHSQSSASINRSNYILNIVCSEFESKFPPFISHGENYEIYSLGPFIFTMLILICHFLCFSFEIKLSVNANLIIIIAVSQFCKMISRHSRYVMCRYYCFHHSFDYSYSYFHYYRTYATNNRIHLRIHSCRNIPRDRLINVTFPRFFLSPFLSFCLRVSDSCSIFHSYRIPPSYCLARRLSSRMPTAAGSLANFVGKLSATMCTHSSDLTRNFAPDVLGELGRTWRGGNSRPRLRASRSR